MVAQEDLPTVHLLAADLPAAGRPPMKRLPAVDLPAAALPVVARPPMKCRRAAARPVGRLRAKGVLAKGAGLKP